ncbi:MULTISPECIES: alpha/beta fold hydrolase [unclassified Leptolyngbya]|uniref:alpha/beta fold hydrolase n=1 Tax=unclassified Leptolyngbya TaxID=2650499 RepID=UPI003D323ECC
MMQPRSFRQQFHLFLDQFKTDLWEFGNLAWLFAIIDRTITAFKDGFPSAVDLAQIFVVALIAFGWLLLSPTSETMMLELYDRFQPIFSFEPSTPTPPSIERLQRFGYQQTLSWRGWKVHHTVFPNPRSEVPVIFVHGFGGSIGHWRQNMSVLSKSHSVYALDLLGFGASDKPDINYSIDLWTEQLYEFWQSCVGKPVILVGNSIGSLVCAVTAAKHPEMVRGVAMISLPDTSSHHEAIPAIIRPIVQFIQDIFTSRWLLYPLFFLLRHPRIVRRWASMAYAGQEAITDELLEILSKPARERGSARAFCAILKAMTHPNFSPNVRSILSNIRTPVLLLWGKQDRMIPAASARQFLQYNPNLKLIELDDAGHCAHDECPERVNAELINWIRSEIVRPTSRPKVLLQS